MLAAHLDGVLKNICDDDEGRRGVVLLDGRWGSGKSTLVNLMLGPYSGDGAAERKLRRPVIVRYDAWRESAVAPEWWSLASTMHRAVRLERPWITRVWMSLCDAAGRTARAPATVTALVALAILLMGSSYGWWPDLKVVGDGITLLTAVAALGLVAGRVLFWAAPAFGRLHARNDDNPLGEISATVARLRRWTPRRTAEQRWADAALGVWLVCVATWTASTVLRRGEGDAAVARFAGWLEVQWLPLALGVVVAGVVLEALLAPRRRAAPARLDGQSGSGSPAETAPTVDGGNERSTLGGRIAAMVGPLDVTSRLVLVGVPTVTGGVATGLFALRTPAVLVPTLQDYAELVGITLVLLGCVGHWVWSRHRLRGPALGTGHRAWRPRRPLLLVIDDLDRCSSERVVRLLETVHTLLREPHRARVGIGWREPAPLLVLVLSDGRWVRASFEKAYEDHKALGSPVHGLGADFTQKLFDHTVLVPSLSEEQVRDYTAAVTRSRGLEPPGPRQPRATDSRAGSAAAERSTRSAEKLTSELRGMDPASVNSDETHQLIEEVDDERKRMQLAAKQASRATDPTVVATVRRHLLTQYPHLMPNNPRLIKRVVNTFGMVNALRHHVRLSQPEDIMVRAAIMFVRFPALVDDLLTCVDPPDIHSVTAAESPWRRSDVQQLLGDVPVAALAACFGRRWPDEQNLNEGPGLSEGPGPAAGGAAP